MRLGSRLIVIATLSLLSAGPAVSQPATLTREQVQAVLRLSGNLAHKNLTGLNLVGLSFGGANLSDADLSGAVLQGVHLEGAKLRRANLRGANLEGALLGGADLTEADLTGATLAGANAATADLTRAKLERANLRRTDLTRTDLQGAQLRGADLSQARLNNARLILARLDAANLTEADLEGASLTMASLVGADLTRANFRHTVLVNAEFSEANIDGANFAKADLRTAKNLDAARNSDKAIWEEHVAGPVGTGQPGSGVGPVVARIYPRNGDPIGVESWKEEGDVIVYTRGGVTYGLAKDNVRRIEDATGQTVREFVEKATVRAGNCPKPRVGDAASYMTNYLKCMATYGVRFTFSQGISARKAGEQTGGAAGPAAAGMLVKRWELRDEAGRLAEFYEAIGDTITLAGE